jgi:hypothetical protein
VPQTNDELLPLELTFEERPGYLYARATALRTNLATAEHYLMRIAERCHEIKCDKVLIYRDIADVLETASMYKVASHVPAALPGVKVAFVNPYDTNQTNMEFGRNIVAKEGGMIGLFKTEAEAIKWLSGAE